MALSYCEICGVLIKGQEGQELPEGVICDTCHASRQVVVGTSSDEAFDLGALVGPVQFECVYCHSLLRLPLPAARTSVRCPQCYETFFLLPDGNVEARLQGNTTAIIAKEQALRSLTPPTGKGRAVTQELPQQSKTQPIKPVSDSQRSALRDLAAQNLDVVKALPTRELLPVDMKRRERTLQGQTPDAGEPAGGELDLELLPADVGPGEAKTVGQLDPDLGTSPELQTADEGRVDLDVAGLKKRTKTAKLDKATGRKKKLKNPTAKLKKKAKKSPEERAEAKERRERRREEASRKAAELKKARASRSLKRSLLWGLVLFPALASLLLISMTTRGTGFATRGQVGSLLDAFGRQIDGGLRNLTEVMPEGLRRPEIPQDRR